MPFSILICTMFIYLNTGLNYFNFGGQHAGHEDFQDLCSQTIFIVPSFSAKSLANSFLYNVNVIWLIAYNIPMLLHTNSL